MNTIRLTRATITIALAFLSAGVWAQENPFPLPPKEWPAPVMDTQRFTFLLLDRFEYRGQKGENERVWDLQGWYGGDYNKLWIKSEGESVPGGRTETADVQALYARRITSFWHLQAGVRQEVRPSPSSTQGVLAIQGLAPYWFNVEASVFVGGGRTSGRFEAEYDQLLTQRWILQPSVETNFSSSSDATRGIGRGFNDVELGLRLRYEFRREFAPYIGVTWTRKLGDTADFARQAGSDVSIPAIVAGLRIWY